MLLPRKWALSLGLLAAIPGISAAGPLDFLKPGSGEKQTAQAPERGNQEVAEVIAKELSKARLDHKDVQIEYKAGVATISGQIKDAPQRALVTRIVGKVPGVNTVENKLQLMQEAAAAEDQPIRQAAAATSEQDTKSVSRAMHEGAADRRVQQVKAETRPNLSNQQVAQQIADSLVTAGLSGYDIEVRYKNGIASLIGSVEDQEQVSRAHQATSSVGGVHEVINKLQVKGKAPQIQQAAGPQYGGPQFGAPQRPMPPGYPVQAGHPQGQPYPPQGHPYPQGISPTAMQQPAGPQGPPPQMAPPQYGHAQPASHQIYNQPNVPEHAWPSYAPYDNMAAVTYPSMYDASAWPYIGPYYPYPQVPMGWRSSTLEWDDGHWNLKFSSRTDKWWWFLNPSNWH
jgi:osmotically-inducible protein OsmY